jgi:hypothetical protein
MPCNDAAHAEDGTDHWQNEKRPEPHSQPCRLLDRTVNQSPHWFRFATNVSLCEKDEGAHEDRVAMPINA